MSQNSGDPTAEGLVQQARDARQAPPSRQPSGDRPRPPGPESPRREGDPTPPSGPSGLLRYWWLFLVLLGVNWLVGQTIIPGGPQRIAVGGELPWPMMVTPRTPSSGAPP